MTKKEENYNAPKEVNCVGRRGQGIKRKNHDLERVTYRK